MPTGRVILPLQLSLFDEAPLADAALTPLPPQPGVPPCLSPAAMPRLPAPAPSLATPEPCTPSVHAPHAPLAQSAPPPLATAAKHGDARQVQPARNIVLGGQPVAYALRRSRRRSIGFVVGADGLAVSAPRWVGLRDIEAALREKADWILRKLHDQHERARRLDQARVDWRDGATIPFLGEAVVLVLDPRTSGAVLHTEAHALPGVPRLTLHLGLPQQATPAQMRDAVQSWLQRQARRIFEERCAHFTPRLNVRVKRLALSSAATRWGSASADGSIRLNWRLVHFALPVIDYVVAHELAHLREMNHSPAFWDVVRGALPGFEGARRRLRSEVLPVF